MKKLLLILIFLSCLSISYAQPYQSMFGSNATEWDILCYTEPSPSVIDAFRYVKDTILNSLTYKIVRSSYDPTRFFYLREDLTTGKVWFKYFNGAADSIYLDYTLTKGTVLHYTGYTDSLVVDSVYTSGGRKHIRFTNDNLGGEGGKMEFIEGVGCTSGFYYRPDWQSGINYTQLVLDCHYKNGILNWSIPGGACAPFTTSVPTAQKSSIRLFPDPATDELNISNATGNEVCIYNLSGQAIYKANIKTDKYSVDVHTWQAGLYFVSLKNEAGIRTIKFVKQ